MILKGNPADDVSRAKNQAEATGIIQEADMELSDEETAQLSGGSGMNGDGRDTKYFECSCCHKQYSYEETKELNFSCRKCHTYLIPMTDSGPYWHKR